MKPRNFLNFERSGRIGMARHRAFSLMKLAFTVALAAGLSWSPAAMAGTAFIRQIAAGDYASYFIKSDGSLWAMGSDGDGQLGDGNTTNHPSPEEIVASGVTSVAGGGAFAIFLKSDGSLWAIGGNISDDLGISGGYFTATHPVLVVGGNVAAISAGEYHSLFEGYGGSLWGMGMSSDGALGDGTTNKSVNWMEPDVAPPEEILASQTTATASGFDHSLFVKSGGSLWSMGYDSSGQLGDGQMNIGTNYPEEIVFSNVTAVAAGNNHSLFIKSNGSLWAMGDDSYGQLGSSAVSGQGTAIPWQIVAGNVTGIAAKGDFSLFTKSDGSLWAMGDDSHGQLGNGKTGSFNGVPVRIVTNGVVAVAAGQLHSLFLKSDGSLWAMGYNLYGQVGDGTTTDRHSPVEILPGVSIPTLVSGSVAGNNLVVHGGNGVAGGSYVLCKSTSLTLPLSQWTPLGTNVLGTNGNFTITATNALNSGLPHQYYIIQLQ